MREEFAHQHRYAMALHAEQKDGHGKHPHVHLVVKAEHQFEGLRLNPRKADLQRWADWSPLPTKTICRQCLKQRVCTDARNAPESKLKRVFQGMTHRA